MELESGRTVAVKTLDRQAKKESGYNPDKMLREFPREILDRASADANYIRRNDDVMKAFRDYMQHIVKVPLSDPPIHVAVRHTQQSAVDL